MPSRYIPAGLGWLPDIADTRDLMPNSDKARQLLEQLKTSSTKSAGGGHKGAPTKVDLREYCEAVADQGNLATSTAHACVALLQYFELRSNGRIIEPSTMFVYWTARRLLNLQGDSGANLRATLKGIVKFGVPPEKHWPYETAKVNDEPNAFAFSFCQSFQNVSYLRLDARGRHGEDTLSTIKSYLAAGFAMVFGFTVFTSLSEDPEIHFPTVFDDVRGGQAALAVGYDDDHRVGSDKGALLIRNSWGGNWGEDGYGWLPYRYIREHVASDFWTWLEPGWLTEGGFCFPQ